MSGLRRNPGRPFWQWCAVLSAVHCLSLTALTAQSAVWARLSGQFIPSLTSVDPIPGGGELGELRVVQPVIMLDAGGLNDHLRFRGTLNLEGQTIPHGELTPGAWGEGFEDRRHPHTYAHELILSGVDLLGRLDGRMRLSLSVGKGFAPFGTDDPMSRPTLRYPVNHHFSQILERAVVIAGVALGPVSGEAGLFNGDEPERPGQWPNLDRFGDSWALRLLLHPLQGLELQGSRARVKSPEHRLGAGTDNWKWSLSARLDRAMGRSRIYGLAEWARTSEASEFFVFRSFLVEGAWNRGPHRPYYRYEHTERPEEERTLDLFRSRRPHLENSILGITLWKIHTLGYGFGLVAAADRLRIEPFAEASFGSMHRVGGGVFLPEQFYGKDHFRAYSLGVRVEWQMHGHRMGRYGVLSEPAMMHEHSHPTE